jgi:nucleoside-diphosphate-sugar epimerase
MKVAVTGASGTVAPFVLDELREHGHEAVGVDKREPPDDRGAFIQADIEDLPSLVTAFEGCDAIVHLAALRSPDLAPPDVVYRVNTVGTINALEAAVNVGASRFVLASSDAVLGYVFRETAMQPEYFPIDEDHGLYPQDSYGLSKAAAEEICRSYSSKGKISTVCLRSCYVWSLSNGEEPYTLLEETEKEYTSLWIYVHARDVARAYRLACEASDVDHEALFIVAKDAMALESTPTLLDRFYPDVELRRAIEPQASLVSGDRARERIGFEPQRSWRDDVPADRQLVAKPYDGPII